MNFSCRLKSLVRLLALAIVLAIPGTVCDAKFSHSRSTSRRYVPLAGIFGFNGDRSKKNTSQQQQQQQQQQQYRNGQAPPPPPPRQSAGTTFVRPPPKTFPPPPPKQQRQQQQQQQSSERRQSPPPPPPPPPVESLEEKVAKELASSKDAAKPDGNVDLETTKSTTSPNETYSDSSVDETKSDNSTVDLSKSTAVSEDTNNVAAFEKQEGSFVLEQQQQPKPQPPPTQWEAQTNTPKYDNQAAAWQDERVQYQDYNQYNQDMASQLQQQYAAEQQQYDTNLYYLQEELSESLSRESSLVSQLDNLTATALSMEQREELHKHQLDVLTERVVDVENRSADDRTLLIEYEANCTALGTTILALHDDLDVWQERCNEWSQKREDDQEKLSELRQAIKEKVSEAEDLAIAMEELRMTENRRQQSTTKANTKSGGLGSLIWSLMGFGKSSSKIQRYDEEVREDAFEMAKSTLLRALQSERTNVHELESAVASLQQNNSAISEMVESRDNIIDELNSRIAVFEEDKVVLKAALRQLQKEMKEEEPKTQKLIDDLAEAEQEIDRIKADFHSIIETHQDELANLGMAMSQKQKTITDAESNLTAIGTYVDKLEDRLTSFAMTRRDMEVREKKCKEIEKKAEESEAKRKSVEEEVEELKKQEDELKKLLEELAVDRTDLQKENRRLYTEQEFRIGEQEKLGSQYETLQAESASMREALQEWKAKCENLVPDLEASRKCQLDLERRVESLDGTEKQLNTLQIQNAVVVEANEKFKNEISATSEEKSRMEAKIVELSKEIEERKEAERLAKEQADKAEAERLARDEAQKRRPPPPPPRRSVQTPMSKPNDVPLRSLRKTLSKATGLHGVLTPSSSTKTIENEDENMRYPGRHSFGERPTNIKPVQLSKASEDSEIENRSPLPSTAPFQEQNQ